MRAEEQTGRHLLLAVTTTVFSGILGLVILILSWELWMFPLLAAGCFSVWFLHIAKLGSGTLYENLCTGLMLVEFFFFSVHDFSLFDLPAVACVLINKKWIMHAIEGLYVLALLYHGLILRTISHRMDWDDSIQLVLGAVIVFCASAQARSWIALRNVQRARY